MKIKLMLANLSDIQKVALFYGLALALSLLVVLIIPLFTPGEAVILLNMLTPLLAVLLMLFVLTGEGYTAVGRASLGLGRLGWRSWGLALLLPLPVLLVSYGLVWSTGLGELILPSGNLPDLLLNVPINLIIGVLFVLSEEIGFRGYALPRLMGLGVGRALLLSGLMHAAWHLPLVLLTPFYHGEGSRLIVILLFLLTLTAAGMIYGHLRLSSGSLWPPILLHSAFNAFWGFFAAITVTTSALATEYLGGESGLFTLLSVILVAGWLVGWRKRPSYQPA